MSPFNGLHGRFYDGVQGSLRDSGRGEVAACVLHGNQIHSSVADFGVSSGILRLA